jgi:uncharacterized protein (TIGR00251 family)
MQGSTTAVPKSIYKNLSRIYLIIRAKPGSKKQGISSINEDEIYVSIKAPPVDGKANSALIEYFSDIFDISKSEVTLEKGGTNKHKLISIADIYTEEEVLQILNDNLL